VSRTVIAALAAIVFITTGQAVAQADAPLRIVVHPQVKGTQVPRAMLAAIFLKQAPRWGDGVPVVPVDQSVKSDVRNLFSNRILNQPLMDVQIYWHRRMSAGIFPPPVKTSDQDVLAFVAATPGAIGYVAASTSIPDTVKVIEISN
jgi:ABC-type phosphate transport system substrate-binding protein